MLPDELSIIDRYFRPLAGEGAFNLFDDAGRLNVSPTSDLVVTTDMIAEGVHFLPGDPPATVAQKALRVNLSDLAAKGARPLAYVLSLALSPKVDAAWLAGFSDGLRRDQATFGIGLLGGDTIAVPDRVVVSITAFGAAAAGRMVHRSGGNPGDILFMSGTLGGAMAGLALLNAAPGPWEGLSESERAALIERYRVPEPRAPLAAAVAEFASAAMDISDGLVGDCDKLCTASGCSATIEAEAVPIPHGLAAADETLLAQLLTGGDDYEILAAVPAAKAAAFSRAAEEAGVPVTRIGVLKAGQERTNVLWHGKPMTLTQRAFVHARGGG